MVQQQIDSDDDEISDEEIVQGVLSSSEGNDNQQ